MSQSLKKLADAFDATLEIVPFSGGSIWYSLRRAQPSHSSCSHIPAGLHLAFGIADLSTSHKFFGGFATNKPVVTAFIVPPEGAVFDTRVGGGIIQSFGLHLSDLEAPSSDPCMLDIIETLQGKPMTVMGGEVARRLSGLRFPIDPWFSGDSRELMFQAKAMELVAVVAEALKDGRKQTIRSLDARRAEAVKEYIEDHLGIDLRLGTIAANVGINARLLTNAFREVFGLTVGEYVLKRRMEESACLLSRGMSVKETASQVGYTPNALSAAFKKYFGYAPNHLQD